MPGASFGRDESGLRLAVRIRSPAVAHLFQGSKRNGLRPGVGGVQQFAAALAGRAGATGPGRPTVRRSQFSACFALVLLTGCGDAPAPPPPAQPFTDPGFADAGHLRLYYALTPTRDLPAGIAGSYGIVQRRNLALLTITLAPQDAPSNARIAANELTATAISLTGLRTPLALVRHDDIGGPTWLATVDIRHRVPVTIEIRVRATADAPEIASRWTREFHLD
jgi:hypothetical protein